jgi:hypothetical protein
MHEHVGCRVMLAQFGVVDLSVEGHAVLDLQRPDPAVIASDVRARVEEVVPDDVEVVTLGTHSGSTIEENRDTFHILEPPKIEDSWLCGVDRRADVERRIVHIRNDPQALIVDPDAAMDVANRW